MKFVIVVLVVGLTLWLLLRQRKGGQPATRIRPDPRSTAQTPQAMVQCSHCGVHLARDEALAGTGGMFCSEAHRLAGPHPP